MCTTHEPPSVHVCAGEEKNKNDNMTTHDACYMCVAASHSRSHASSSPEQLLPSRPLSLSFSRLSAPSFHVCVSLSLRHGVTWPHLKFSLCLVLFVFAFPEPDGAICCLGDERRQSFESSRLPSRQLLLLRRWSGKLWAAALSVLFFKYGFEELRPTAVSTSKGCLCVTGTASV